MEEPKTQIPYRDALCIIEKVGQQIEVKGMSFKFEQAKLQNNVPNIFVEYHKAVGSIMQVEDVKKQQNTVTFKESAPIRQVQPVILQRRSSIDVKRMQSTVTAAGADIMRIAREIEGEVGKIEGEIENKMKSVGRGNLIMDKMSLQDQISDLEMTCLGIDQGAFSEAQLAIIKREVKNLQRTAQKQDISKLDDAQKAIVKLRDQKLEDALNKLALNN